MTTLVNFQISLLYICDSTSKRNQLHSNWILRFRLGKSILKLIRFRGLIVEAIALVV